MNSTRCPAPAFRDRTAAGRELAQALCERALRPPVIVLALPRGGVPVAREVARALNAPLDVLVVRKIALSSDPELAVGALAPGGILVREPGHGPIGDPDDALFEQSLQRELLELQRRELLYRAGKPALQLDGMTAVVVDDGLATGSTMVAALQSARHAGARKVVCAAPVASREAIARIAPLVDDLVIIHVPDFLYSVGEWYGHFEQVADTEVLRLLGEERNRATRREPPPPSKATC